MARKYKYGVVRKVGNAVIGALLRAGVAPRSYVLLTTSGRRTGLPRTTPIRLLKYDGKEWLVAPYGEVAWVHNARAAGKVELRHGRSTRTVSVFECGAEESAPVLREYIRKEPVTRPYFDAKRRDPVRAFAAEASAHPVFRIADPPNPS
ncbi:nitroreductase family deazaflavin-dependent oxidoreductase [Kibdelosporangium aridum]|uniref:Deazaflavin-dependent oxidoreductase, nitroreductase family n=1 Tax=Kibdelosporangium aridum TaxID=2030 RepID=A0A1Y5Y384_KIBAR|nr:nitroreductase family deazaflavin-dependent oxidoreductase [Kibdelosporangium aridum]SMD24949.1 deazaflavin-dependent oxidoreductase, nitroreductase family [Kibdelosporangium aridum]